MEDTPSLRLAKQYLQLGGTRKSKIDDNITDTRKWDDEPRQAAAFWKENIEVLHEDERKQVEDFLPSINDLQTLTIRESQETPYVQSHHDWRSRP